MSKGQPPRSGILCTERGWLFFSLSYASTPPLRCSEKKEMEGREGRRYRATQIHLLPPPPSSFVPRSFYCDVIFYAPWPPVLARSNGPFYRFVAINEIYYRTIDRSIDRYESRSFESSRRFFETKFVLLEINCEERERESETGRNKRKKLLLIELEGNELRSARMSEVKRVESGRGSCSGGREEEEGKRRGGRRKRKPRSKRREKGTRRREAVMRLAITLPNWTRSTEQPSGQNYKIPPRASTFRTRGENRGVPSIGQSSLSSPNFRINRSKSPWK